MLLRRFGSLATTAPLHHCAGVERLVAGGIVAADAPAVVVRDVGVLLLLVMMMAALLAVGVMTIMTAVVMTMIWSRLLFLRASFYLFR